MVAEVGVTNSKLDIFSWHTESLKVEINW